MIRIELQRLLDERNMSQRELSRRSGVRQERISQICRGFVSQIGLAHIDAICKALNVPPWEWIVWERDE